MRSGPTILVAAVLDSEGPQEIDSDALAWLEGAGAEVRLVDPSDPDPFGSSTPGSDAPGGLLLAGGFFDLPPSWYGEQPRARVDAPRLRRSRLELRLLRSAWDRGRACLGICGGAQLMAVERGGSLVQDIASELPGGLDHERSGDSEVAVHRVRISEDAPLLQLFGEREIAVNSTHHQCVRDPGRGMRVAGRAPDGVIEAIWSPARPFWLGVQWHPERLACGHARRLARAFVRAALRVSG